MNNVAFGQSRHAELCYVAALSYPAGVLSGLKAPTLIDVDNICIR